MFKGHFEGVFAELIETVAGPAMAGLGPYCLVADIDARGEAGEVDVYPVGILGQGIEETAIFYDVGIDRVFKGIRETGLIECLILVWWEVDLEIASPFGGVYAIAGQEKDQEQEGEAGVERHWFFGFKIASGWRLLL
jgi:hypothetical protein